MTRMPFVRDKNFSNGGQYYLSVSIVFVLIAQSLHLFCLYQIGQISLVGGLRTIWCNLSWLLMRNSRTGRKNRAGMKNSCFCPNQL